MNEFPYPITETGGVLVRWWDCVLPFCPEMVVKNNKHYSYRSQAFLMKDKDEIKARFVHKMKAKLEQYDRLPM